MDRAALITALQCKSVALTANHFKVHRRTVYVWCKRHGIVRRTYRCPDVLMLRRLEADCVFQRDIARVFGVSRWTIRRWCQRFGIAHFTTGHFRPGTNLNTRDIHEEMPFGLGVILG
jgi:transposase